MSTLFTKIINREIPGYIVAEDDAHIAFLDIFPLNYGHTLVVPKNEVDYVFDMNPDDLAQLMAFAQKVAKAIKMVVPCNRIGVSVVGLEVPHAHVHLIPINSLGDMNFSKEKLSPEKFEMIEMTEKIQKAFQSL